MVMLKRDNDVDGGVLFLLVRSRKRMVGFWS